MSFLTATYTTNDAGVFTDNGTVSSKRRLTVVSPSDNTDYGQLAITNAGLTVGQVYRIIGRIDETRGGADFGAQAPQILLDGVLLATKTYGAEFSTTFTATLESHVVATKILAQSLGGGVNNTYDHYQYSLTPATISVTDSITMTEVLTTARKVFITVTDAIGLTDVLQSLRRGWKNLDKDSTTWDNLDKQ